MFIEQIKTDFPKSYKYFKLFYEENYKDLPFTSFSQLAFEFQLGLFICFFNSVNTDLDMYSNELEALKDSTRESFSTYDEYLFLDS